MSRVRRRKETMTKSADVDWAPSAGARRDLLRALSTLISDIEQFDSVLRTERDRLMSRPSAFASAENRRAGPSRRVSARATVTAARAREALSALRRSSPD